MKKFNFVKHPVFPAIVSIFVIQFLIIMIGIGKLVKRASSLETPPASCRYDNLLLGAPGKSDCLIDRSGYALGYSEEHEQALFVIYKLTSAEISPAKSFRTDPAIPSGSANSRDYKNSGYDRGHLAPAADMDFSRQTLDDCFYYSNISPQNPEFNRGIWKKLENHIRHLARTEDQLYIVSGPIFDDTAPEYPIHIGPNRVTVPSAYYKVIYDLTPPEKMIGFILPNRKCSGILRNFAVTVDTVEQKTGLNFFPLLPEEQKKLKKVLNPDDWQWDF